MVLTGVAVALAGCGRGDVKVQVVPKQSDAMAAANPHGLDQSAMAFHGQMGGPQAQVKWTLPSGWTEKQLSQMRVGSFDAKAKDGQVADVSIIPLQTGGPQMELANFNMWRSELQLPAVQTPDSSPVTVGSAQGKLYEISEGKVPGRILIAALDRDGMTWYFKMKGEDAAVREEKPSFLEFLKSITFEAPAEMAAASPHGLMSAGMSQMTADNSGAPAQGTVPSGWKSLPPSEFLLAKYEITGADGAKAGVNVSELNLTGGGLFANVNRWRGQLGLQPIDQAELAKQVTTVDVTGGQASFVDITGTDPQTSKPSRLIGVVLPRAGETWFYKLMGDPQVVEQQKTAFTNFIQSARYSNAP